MQDMTDLVSEDLDKRNYAVLEDLDRRYDAVTRNIDGIKRKLARLQRDRGNSCVNGKIKCLEYQLALAQECAQRLTKEIQTQMSIA